MGMVAPRVGAWIETTYHLGHEACAASLPVKQRQCEDRRGLSTEPEAVQSLPFGSRESHLADHANDFLGLGPKFAFISAD